MEVQPREIRNYLRTDGTNPFEDWYDYYLPTLTAITSSDSRSYLVN